MSQLANTIGKLDSQNFGHMPSQLEVNPKQNMSAMTLRNGKKLNEPAKKASKFIEDEELRKEMELQQPGKSVTSQTKQPLVIPPPFLSRLARYKKE